MFFSLSILRKCYSGYALLLDLQANTALHTHTYTDIYANAALRNVELVTEIKMTETDAYCIYFALDVANKHARLPVSVCIAQLHIYLDAIKYLEHVRYT